jgi:lycopene beta-cyclase
MYILPTSATSALIEHTVFTRTPFSQEEHLAECKVWAERQGYGELQIDEQEYGRIPMGLQQSHLSNPPLKIGTAAGAVRISTGYGFQAILREASLVARRLARKGTSKPASTPAHANPWPRWIRFSDTLFIMALARRPSRGQAIMAELLRQAPETALIPFLAGTASFSQALRVMSCVPKLQMLRALVTQEELLHETA